MRPITAEFLLFVSGTRHNFFLSLSKPVPRPPCLEPDNISLMRPIKAEFLLLCLVTPLSAPQDTVRKAWFPTAAWVQVMGDKAVAAVDGLENRGLPVKLHLWKCIEGLIPPDLEEVTQYMGSSNVSLPMITKKAKQPKAARLWEHHLCHPDNDLVDPIAKRLQNGPALNRVSCQRPMSPSRRTIGSGPRRTAGPPGSMSSLLQSGVTPRMLPSVMP